MAIKSPAFDVKSGALCLMGGDELACAVATRPFDQLIVRISGQESHGMFHSGPAVRRIAPTVKKYMSLFFKDASGLKHR